MSRFTEDTYIYKYIYKYIIKIVDIKESGELVTFVTKLPPLAEPSTIRLQDADTRTRTDSSR